MGCERLAVLCVTTIGCVIPTPLQNEDTQTYYNPVIVSGDPAFGPLTFSVGRPWNLRITALDLNGSDDVLRGRLAIKNGDLFLDYDDDTLTVASEDGTLRAGAFERAQCPEAGIFYVFAFVYDRSFPTNPSTFALNDLLAGHFDYKYWVVTCQ